MEVRERPFPPCLKLDEDQRGDGARHPTQFFEDDSVVTVIRGMTTSLFPLPLTDQVRAQGQRSGCPEKNTHNDVL